MELQLVNTLTLESEKADIQLLPKLRNSLPNYEVSAWEHNSSIPYTQFDSTLPKQKIFSNLSRKASLSPLLDTKSFSNKESQRMKNTPTPLAYKIATIALNDVQSFAKEKKLKKIADRYKLMDSSSKFASIYFPRKGTLKKNECKRTSVPEITNLLKLLKPEKKHPVKAAVVPKLKSRTELYRSLSKKKQRKKMNFWFLENMSPEPVKINLKAFK